MDEHDVHHLIARFANCFDLKAWDDLTDCLTESIHTDDSDLHGTPPETMPRERFVELRRQALQALQTHHLTGNGEVSLEAERGSARVSMVIYRKNHAGVVLNTHCVYVFGVTKTDGRWRISSIHQKVLWNDGDPAIDEGIVKR